ncbi:MAG: hypothetical protein LBN97_09370 [Oscillospiraceae bacterium]|jgi:hypothetical protein|nr:hypothetical protein [Oscillospiraceae bacterium]
MNYKDTLVEELIRQKRTGREALYKIGAVIAALVIVVAAMLLIPAFTPVIVGILALALFFAFKYTIKEYEYSFMNGELDFDLIMGQRKRRTVMSVNCKQIRSFGENDTEPGSAGFIRILDASVSPNRPRMHFTVVMGDDKESLIFFSPTERLKSAMLEFIPKKAVHNGR